MATDELVGIGVMIAVLSFGAFLLDSMLTRDDSLPPLDDEEYDVQHWDDEE